MQVIISYQTLRQNANFKNFPNGLSFFRKSPDSDKQEGNSKTYKRKKTRKTQTQKFTGKIKQ